MADPIPRWGDRRRTRVGLLGGSFNPAHPGHLHVARLALRRLRLDQVWLVVSPGNPLKSTNGMATMPDRFESAATLAPGLGIRRRILATAIESHLDTSYTYDTLRALRVRFPRIRFVWLMGADNLVQLPRWQRWVGIAQTMPFAVMPRPTYNQRALASQAAHRLRPALQPARSAPQLPRHTAPAWTFLPARQHAASATAIRERGRHEPHLAWPRLPHPPPLAKTAPAKPRPATPAPRAKEPSHR